MGAGNLLGAGGERDGGDVFFGWCLGVTSEEMNVGFGGRGGLDLARPSTSSAPLDISMDVGDEEGLGEEGGDVS